MSDNELSSVGQGKWEFKDGKLFYGTKFIANLYQEVDGYYVMDMNNLTGYFSSWILIQIGECLDVLNKEWDNQVNKAFDKLNSSQNHQG